MEPWQSIDSVSEWLHALETLAGTGDFRIARWGASGDLPLLGLARPGKGRAPRIYLSAGIHGDEPAGPLAVQRLLQDDLLSRDASWTICPLLNPHAWIAGSRETRDGVDMNRDYRQPRSPEVAAHRRWIDSTAPNDLFLSLHEDWEAAGFYLYEINTSTFPPLGREILHRVKEVMPIERVSCIDQHDVCEPGYIVHAPEPDEPFNWPEAIYHIKRYPHLSYTFETPSSLALEPRIQAHVTAVTAAVECFLRFYGV